MKKTTLKRADWIHYLFQLYFGSEEPLSCCLDRAYRDFNRTLHGIGKHKKNKELYEEGKEYLKKQPIAYW